MKKEDFNTGAVVKVGDGRGFIVEYRKENLPFKGKRSFSDTRLVITAAHCLSRKQTWFGDNRTYENLLGRLDEPEPHIWATCRFFDPIADIAIFCEPDPDCCENEQQYDAYFALTEELTPFRIGPFSEGRAWLLALSGEWVPVMVGAIDTEAGIWIEPTDNNQGGMSGSPILADDGSAISLVSIGGETVDSVGIRTPVKSGPQPVLMHHLPGWLAGQAGRAR